MTTTPPRSPEEIGTRVIHLLSEVGPLTTSLVRNRFYNNERGILKRVLVELEEAGAITRTEYQPTTGRGGYKYELARETSK
ncbi:hypothetical protein KZO37_14030 [Rhodococcus fascians]|uniref:hypothetical protein n=1 Tax=Rhodococcoides fascians TaxID=1828 RepID=UPI001C605A12|nr:hypothetical protein [Rhodococcus fascians]MBW4780486.1 hypothetical protein [Rhodococcus fascians]